MTAYVYPDTIPTIGLITDNTNEGLTYFTQALVEEYRQHNPNRETQTLLIVFPSERSFGHIVQMWTRML
jgi:hypothetical protein